MTCKTERDMLAQGNGPVPISGFSLLVDRLGTRAAFPHVLTFRVLSYIGI